jgi:chromosome segregation ATPase
LETIRARKAIDAELLHALKGISSDPLFKEIESKLNTAMDELERIGNFLDHTLQGEHYKAIEALQRNKKRELDTKIDLLRQLHTKSKTLESDLTKAQETLRKNEGRLTEEEKKLQTAILELQKEIEDKPFEHAYQVQREKHESVVLQIQDLQKKLAEVKEGVDAATKFARDNLKVLQESIPTVKRIIITGSTQAITKNNPLTFEIEGRWKGLPVLFTVEWAPGWSVPELYNTIGHKLIENAGKL